jgi:PPK2 family polyphosphate:nucleotide phosphotransferase
MNPDRFRVRPGSRVRLSSLPTRVGAPYRSKADYEASLAAQIERLQGLQNLLYADDRQSLLLVFQAMDAAGKDGCIKHVMSGVNPQGCQVYSFKHPSAEELDHDFLWRTTRALPERGRIGIFNRSYYEEVLIVRVHPEILRSQKLPPGRAARADFWEDRYRSIRELEAHLHRSGTHVIKFFLHLSKEEQRRRFLARLDDPEKNWKFSEHDLEERGFWKSYRRAYEACLEATSTKHAPWYVVPADDKPTARLIVADVVVRALQSLELAYPRPDAARRRELAALRRRLAR